MGPQDFQCVHAPGTQWRLHEAAGASRGTSSRVPGGAGLVGVSPLLGADAPPGNKRWGSPAERMCPAGAGKGNPVFPSNVPGASLCSGPQWNRGQGGELLY